ncbi:MAG: hypothetical protein RLZZ617_951, partial [Bacteroidota bacterium]
MDKPGSLRFDSKMADRLELRIAIDHFS